MDEVSFLGPEVCALMIGFCLAKPPPPPPPVHAQHQVWVVEPQMGPLASILVAPESGSWLVDEINVSSSRTGHMDRSASPLTII